MPIPLNVLRLKLAGTHLALRCPAKLRTVPIMNQSTKFPSRLEVRQSCTTLLLTILVCAASVPSWAATAVPLPPPVQKTISSLAPNGRVLSVERTMEHGRELLEIEVRHGGQERTLTIAPDGTLLARQVFFSELPAPVAAALKEQAKGSKVQEIFWTIEEGEPAFFVQLGQGTRQSSLLIDPTGLVVSRQVLLEEIPAPARSAIQTKVGQTPINRIDVSGRGEEATYEVETGPKGSERTWLFTPAGALLGTEVSSAELPLAMQKTLSAEMPPGAHMLYLFKELEDDQAYYEATFLVGTSAHGCTIDTEGQLVSRRLPLKAAPPLVQKSVADVLGTGRIIRVEQHLEKDNVHFEIKISESTTNRTLVFSPDHHLRE